MPDDSLDEVLFQNCAFLASTYFWSQNCPTLVMGLALSLEASPVGKNFASLVENVRRPAGIEEKSLSALWGSAASMSLLDPNEQIVYIAEEKKKKYVRLCLSCRVLFCEHVRLIRIHNTQCDDGRRIVGSKHEEKMCNNAH